MNLSTLRNFITIAYCGSFTRASEQLLVSQPALSRQIHELEEELGVKLFERDKIGIKITEAGALLVEEAKAIEERCDRLPELFHPSQGTGKCKAVHEVLRIGCQRFLNTARVYQAVASLRQLEPRVEVQMTQGNAADLRQGLLSNRFDVVISLQIYYDSLQDIQALPFEENRFQVVMPIDHPLAKRERVKISDLKVERFILLRRELSPLIVDRFIALCMNHGFSPETSRYVSSAEEGLRLVALEGGIALLPSQMWQEGMDRQYQVCFVDLDEPEADLPLVMAYNVGNPKRGLRCLIRILNSK